jgi:hypothetical protein
MCGLLWCPGGERLGPGPHLVSSCLGEEASEVEVVAEVRGDGVVEDVVWGEDFMEVPVERQGFLVVGVREEWWLLETGVVFSSQVALLEVEANAREEAVVGL